VIALLAGVAHAGAWTRELGQVYAKAGVDGYYALRYVVPGTDQAVDDGFTGQQYGVYAEVGVLPGWRGQLTVAAPLLTVGTHSTLVEDPFSTERVRASTLRPGDLRVAAQLALHRTLPLAVSVDVKVPAYDNGGVGSSYPAYRALFPKPGDGQVDVGAMAWAGASLPPGGFAEVGVGFVHRTEAFVAWDPGVALTDGLRFSAKAGAAVGRVTPIAEVGGVISPAATPYTRSAVTASATALIDLAGGFAIEPRVAADLWTRNTTQGLGAGLGLSWRR
jgi:hypothetical protein